MIETLNQNSGIYNKLAFKADNDVKAEEVKSDLVTSPENDEFKKEETDVKKEQPKKKKHLVRKIALGVVSSAVMIYGSIVLKRKLSKPSFEEVQKCFQEIFSKDLSKDEVKELINKYKTICKNNNTEDFSKKMIEQLKKDYGIEQVETKVNIEKLKDSSIRTAMEQTEGGNADPLGIINIKPSTHSDNLIRSIQSDTFSTGFHELKHLKQFAEAYRANPEKFAEAIVELGYKSQDKNKLIETFKQGMRKNLEKQWETSAECKKAYKTFDEFYQDIMKELHIKTDDDLLSYIKKISKEKTKAVLDERYGKLERYKEGTAEYNKGMEYIKAYSEYPDASKDYQAYRNNLLEKEAWHIGDLANKIYKYSSSIWKF